MKYYTPKEYKRYHAIMDAIIKNIKREMKKKKLNGSDLSRYTGLGQGHIANLLLGNRPCSLEAIRLIGLALGVPAKSLLPAKG